MPWRPEFPGEVPSLGWHFLEFVDLLNVPDRPGDDGVFTPTREQAEFALRFYELDPVTGRRKYRRGAISRPRGWGKALALDTPLPTPAGWTTMGEVAVGDVLFDETGSSCRVVGKTPVWHGTDCFMVEFSDGQVLTASADHLWAVRDLDARSGVRTIDTANLARTFRRGSRGGSRYSVLSPDPIQTQEAELPVDPYVLGYWLGDGDSDGGRVTTADPECIDMIREAGFEVAWQGRYRFGVYGLVTLLRRAGVLKNKHIPAEYLRASIEQRFSLLRGLMDSDGTAETNGRVEFCTTDAALASGMTELLASLGFKHNVTVTPARLYGKDCGDRWRIRFCAKSDTRIFGLDRKQGRLPARAGTRELYRSRRIVGVTPVDSVPTVCIEVDSPSHLFLAGERMVPTHNSPFAGAFCWFEALGAAVPDGWDADGRPVGRPWWTIRTPLVRVAAVSEAQTANTWNPIHDMVTDRLLDAFPGLEPMETFVALPYGRGRIEQITASANTAKGQPAVFTLCDQIEVWYRGNGGVALHNVLATNLAKGRGGGHLLYTPNAFVPGTHSVAEDLYDAVRAQREGRTRNLGDLLYDHREAPADTELTDRESLTLGLRTAYGDSSDDPAGCVIHQPPCEPGWSPIQSHIARVWDVDIDEQEARADFLNQITAASDSFVSQPEWAARKSDAQIELGDIVTLGFDGSRGRAKGKPDATALVGCRVSDGHVFQVGVWEADDRPETWDSWEPPVPEIEAALAEVFDRYTVVGFYADPAATWRSFTTAWEARWGAGMLVKGRRDHPFEWWMTGQTNQRTEAAVEAFYAAVAEGDMSHDGSRALTRHMLNARRRLERGRLKLEKESKSSGNKIDAAIAAVLAWQARLDAVSAGAGVSKRSVTVPTRVRRPRR